VGRIAAPLYRVVWACGDRDLPPLSGEIHRPEAEIRAAFGADLISLNRIKIASDSVLIAVGHISKGSVVWDE
jgi:hypothetical protein